MATATVSAVAAMLSLIKQNNRSESVVGDIVTIAQENNDSGVKINSGHKPFEITALSNYYKHALSRANISFWFSIIFASIGFCVIIFAFASHSPSDIGGTVTKVVSGTVIDAVSALFFVQSTNAQKSMGEFFEKLRLDRLNAEAREMIGEIEDAERRDQLRSQLVLKYSGIDKLLVGEKQKN